MCMQWAWSITPQCKCDSNVSLLSNIGDGETVLHYVIRIAELNLVIHFNIVTANVLQLHHIC